MAESDDAPPSEEAEGTDADGAESVDCSCKVDRIAGKYGLEGIHRELEDRWVRPEDPDSLRELATEFNERVLRSAMLEAGMNPIDGETTNLYRLLTEESVSRSDRIRAVNRLEREGVDIEAVDDDFVSHQTIYRHLRQCLQAERGSATERSDMRHRIEMSDDRIQSLRNRTSAVAEDTVERLRDKGALDVDEFHVYVGVTFTCMDCGSTYEASDFLENRGCDCKQ
ncbi:rod-determining factor RdfA [Halorarius halobius]|uniref:rod-determining factor RdfA n=1 Tax=Halorarius halobius TaxID=2962671 RepID=UPI0020CEE21C|nr:rod-determining factor RdfA [Halorarius halobius]